eukprot:720683-Pelagomonas_calceolata.AAC.4
MSQGASCIAHQASCRQDPSTERLSRQGHRTGSLRVGFSAKAHNAMNKSAPSVQPYLKHLLCICLQVFPYTRITSVECINLRTAQMSCKDPMAPQLL